MIKVELDVISQLLTKIDRKTRKMIEGILFQRGTSVKNLLALYSKLKSDVIVLRLEKVKGARSGKPTTILANEMQLIRNSPISMELIRQKISERYEEKKNELQILLSVNSKKYTRPIQVIEKTMGILENQLPVITFKLRALQSDRSSYLPLIEQEIIEVIQNNIITPIKELLSQLSVLNFKVHSLLTDIYDETFIHGNNSILNAVHILDEIRLKIASHMTVQGPVRKKGQEARMDSSVIEELRSKMTVVNGIFTNAKSKVSLFKTD